MSNQIALTHGEIKEIATNQGGTPTERFVAVLIAAGVTDSAEIAAITGLKLRAAQAAKRSTLRAAECADAIHCAQHTAPAQQDAPKTQHTAPIKKVSPTPPSKNNTKTTTSLPVAAGEPEGWAALKAEFNGSTAAMVADVQRYLAPYGDKQSAVNWLGGTLAAFGRSRTAQAWTIIVAKVAAGEPIRNALPLWAKTAKGLADDPVAAEAAIHNPFAEMTKGVVRHAKPAPGSVMLPELH